MPDPDRTARELMDAPGTRVTPEPDEHPRDARDEGDRSGRAAAPGHTADDRTAATPDDFAGRGRAGDTGSPAVAGIGIGANDGALAADSDGSRDTDEAAGRGGLSRNAPNGGAADAIRTDVPGGGADDIAATEGGTGTSGSRGGGPAADFRDTPGTDPER